MNTGVQIRINFPEVWTVQGSINIKTI
jgi:hypothetical protein